MAMRRIVCPIDFTEESFVALAGASAFASYSNATLYVVHVVPKTLSETTLPRQEHEALCVSFLEEAIEQYVSEDVEVRPVLVDGDTADEIARVARDVNAGLVVMATRLPAGRQSRRTEWLRVTDGSLAQEVACLSRCPVLAVRVNSHSMTRGKMYDQPDSVLAGLYTANFTSMN